MKRKLGPSLVLWRTLPLESSFLLERSEAGGFGAGPHEEKEDDKTNDAPLALWGPLPWRPFFCREMMEG